MKGIKTNKNFTYALYFIDEDGSRIYCSSFPNLAKAIKGAEETLYYNEMIGREYLLTMDDQDGEILNELFYITWDGNEFKQTAYSI